METLLRRYARLIIEVQLKLRPGDSLSINSTSSTLAFARLLAQQACLTTLQTVTIVHTNHGKVVDAIPIDPKQTDVLRPPVQGAVMCHIVDLDDNPYLEFLELDDSAKEVATLSQYGLLAEPIFLDRRIAVPWANIPYPGPRWASQLLDKQSSEEDMWMLFSMLYRIEDEHAFQFWEEQGNLLAYRKQMLNEQKEREMTLIGDGWQLQTKQAKDTTWAGGRHTLKSLRSFFSALPVQSIHVGLDRTKTNGTFAASKSFYLLGRKVVDATFTVENGKIVQYDAKEGADALQVFFSIDEGAKQVSELCLADEGTIESRYLHTSIHPHFAKELSSALVLGGFSLDTLTTQENVEDVETSLLNDSLVRLEIPIGDRHLSVSGIDSDGETKHIIVEGVFAE